MSPARARALLGLGADADAPAVRRAYADRLRVMDPDTDPGGFAALRDARDILLAATRRPTPEAVADPFAEAAPVAEWRYAAPRIAAEGPGIAAQLPTFGDAPFFPGAGAPAGGPADAPLTLDHWPFAIPRLVDRAPAAGEVLADRGRWAALDSLLTAGDTGTAMTEAESARAAGHLAVVIRLIDCLPIDQSADAEGALAQMLARGWPRSAPLLETAATAFGWLGEQGQLKERPAVAFLNARLNGLRFVEQVETSGHPLHGAWVELSKPGFRRNRFARRAQIVKLLTKIRSDFPEVESYLDPQRVGAWEPVLLAPNTNWVEIWARRISRWYIFLIIAGVGLVHLLLDPVDVNVPQGGLVHSAQTLVLDDAARHWFGPETDLARLRQTAPLVALIAAGKAQANTDAAGADRIMRNAVFIALAVSTQDVDAARLRALQAVRAQALDAASKASMRACMDFLKLGQVDETVVLPDAVTRDAVAQVRAIAETGLYSRKPEIKPVEAAVPGSIVRAVMRKTGIPQDRVRAALQQRGSDAGLCLVHGALLNEALKLPGRAGEAILRTL